MLFTFKPKKIHLDCFTYRPDVYEFSPITYGTQTYPEWWKNLSKGSFDFESMQPKPTMKTCSGFIDYFKKAVTIPLWSSLAIKLMPSEDGNMMWHFADKQSAAEVHDRFQFEGYVGKDYQHLKLTSPWQFVCKEPVSWVWSGNPWDSLLLYKAIVLPGVVEYRYQHSTEIQLMLHRESAQQNIMLEHGTPLVNLFPMSERAVQLHNHLVSEQEFAKIAVKSRRVVFTNMYRYTKNLLQNKEKCPFH